MKTLLILRHAKSSWDIPDISDYERPLNDRGRTTAPYMGRLIADRGLVPEMIISSPARRAADTAKLAAEAMGLKGEPAYDERIYEASPQALRQVAAEVDDTLESILLVGHNPGIEGFIRFLSGKDESVPTAALAVLRLDIDRWENIAQASAALVELIRPKEEMRKAGKGN